MEALFYVDSVLPTSVIVLVTFSILYIADKGESMALKVSFWLTWVLSTVLAVASVVLEALSFMQAVNSGATNYFGYKTGLPLSCVLLLLIGFLPLFVRAITESRK